MPYRKNKYTVRLQDNYIQTLTDKQLADYRTRYDRERQIEYSRYVTQAQTRRGFHGNVVDTSIKVDDFDTYFKNQNVKDGTRSSQSGREWYYAPIFAEQARRTNLTATQAISRQNQAKATETANNPVVDTDTDTEKKSRGSSGYSGGNKRTRYTSNPIIGGVSSRTGIKI